MKKNIAVVGFGFMGMTHAFNILNNPNLNLVAIVDKNADKVKENLKKNVGNISTNKISSEDIADIAIYNDIEDCIKSEKLDACIVSVHTSLHIEIARAALNNDISVFVEKPFTLNVEDGQELIDLAKSKSKILMVGHVVRFMTPYEQLKSWIDSKEFGELELLTLSRFSGLPSWGQWKENQANFGSSGGALFDLVIHDIDFAQWVCGFPDDIQKQLIAGKLSNHDYVSTLWTYNDSNLRVKIDGGNTFHSLLDFKAGFTARFERATVSFSSVTSDKISIITDDSVTEFKLNMDIDGYDEELSYFTKCLLNNTYPEKCTPESALASIEICNIIANHN